MTYQLLAMGAATTKDDPRFSQERLVNCHYVQAPPLGGSGQALLKQSYGLRNWLDVENATGGRDITGPTYALKVIGDRLYFATSLDDGVVVTGFAERDADPGFVGNVGTYGEISHRISTPFTFIESDGTRVFTLYDSQLEELRVANTSTTAITPLTTPGSLAFLDNYLLAGDTETKLIAWSNAGDGRTWDALDFASAESNTSDIVRIFVDHSEMYVFKTDRTEIWATSGGAQQFVRISGGVERGLAGRMCVTKSENLVYFIGDDRVIYAISLQSQPVRVSNPAVERILQDVDGFDGVLAYSWTEGGTRFSGWRFPDRPAVVLDHDTGLWHERSSGLNGEPYMVTSTATFAGKQLAGCSDGHIREFVPDAYADGGVTVSRDVYTAPLVLGGERFCLDYLAVDLRQGDVNLGYDPSVMLRLSRDGKQWGEPKVRTFGDLGTHQRVTSWRGMGQARHVDAHLRVTDPVPFSLYGGVYEVS